jgi:S1-C subfamily serine protease
VVAAMTHARELICVLSASATLVVPALAEDLDCRWFFPAIGRTLPVRCDEAVTSSSSAAAQEVPAERGVLGLTLAPLSQDLIDKYSIEKRLNGVVVTQVDANSEAAGRGITSGDVVLQTNQDVVSTPDDMVRNIDSATKDGHKTILLLLSNARGETQSVSLSLG